MSFNYFNTIQKEGHLLYKGTCGGRNTHKTPAYHPRRKREDKNPTSVSKLLQLRPFPTNYLIPNSVCQELSMKGD